MYQCTGSAVHMCCFSADMENVGAACFFKEIVHVGGAEDDFVVKALRPLSYLEVCGIGLCFLNRTWCHPK